MVRHPVAAPAPVPGRDGDGVDLNPQILDAARDELHGEHLVFAGRFGRRWGAGALPPQGPTSEAVLVVVVVAAGQVANGLGFGPLVEGGEGGEGFSGGGGGGGVGHVVAVVGAAAVQVHLGGGGGPQGAVGEAAQAPGPVVAAAPLPTPAAFAGVVVGQDAAEVGPEGIHASDSTAPLDWVTSLRVQRCLTTSTETVSTIRDREPRTAT